MSDSQASTVKDAPMEKSNHVDFTPSKRADLERSGEKDGYILDPRFYSDELGTTDLKTAHDGRTVLIPQPSNSSEDPLNWSKGKKMVYLLIISVTAFLPDYGSSMGAVTLLPQSAQWHLPETTVNHALVGNLAMLGIGGIFVVTLSAYFGRLPVLVSFLSVSLGTACWCAAATSFDSFMTARILNGFFSTVAQAGGLMFIKDLFFFHQHPRKINIWSGCIVLSPYLGPFTAAFVIWKHSWRWSFWILAILNAICLILVVSLMDETYFDRNTPDDGLQRRFSWWKRLVGIEQRKNHLIPNTFKQALMRPAIAISKLPVLLATVYYVFTFAWVIGLNATISIFLVPLYGFGPKQIGLYYFTPIVATILGELAGHWLHDLIAKPYTKAHGGRLEPEARLIAIWLATPFMVVGIVVLGYSLQEGWHYMVTAVAWGLFVFGIMIVTTAINAYVLDAYPEGSGEVAAWINFGRTLGGFVITYEQIKWATAMGTKKSLGIQASIVVMAFFIIVFLQFYGKQLRRWQGRMEFAN